MGKGRVARTWRWTARALCALGLLVVLVSFTPLVPLWVRLFAGPMEQPSGDILIVLGGSIADPGLLNESSYWRCRFASDTFRKGGFREIIVSGGGSVKVAAGPAMRDFLVAFGVPPEQIRTETRSTSTRENALYVKEMLARESGRKVLLTSDFHIWRARRTFAKAGLAVLPRPAPDALLRARHWQDRWRVFLELTTEAAKISYYFVRGWI